MSMELFERAVEQDDINLDNYVEIAFKEILMRIYYSGIKESELDELINKMFLIVSEKLNIQEDAISLESIEKWYYEEVRKITDPRYYFKFEEIKKIICKSKLLENNDFETITSSAMDIQKINEKILKSLEEYLDEYNNEDKETMNEFLEKGLYIDFREHKN